GIYNKFSPQVADRKDNSLRKKKFNINLYIALFLLFLQFKGIRNSNPVQIFGDPKENISISFK
ncbi:hypothetical protein, partial [Snodgrassella alvi]|uniref:hypothetical protein n=1 Tax=Snodgrassella alvi TaxID=1196083 RepID=UPI001C0D5471